MLICSLLFITNIPVAEFQMEMKINIKRSRTELIQIKSI